MPTKVLIVPGSLRSGSFNVTLAQAVNKVLAEMGAETTMISLGDYPLPIVDEDLNREKGTPDNAVKLARLLAGHDALFILSPEYNSSIPPLIKNTIDWISLVKADVKPFQGLTVALGGATNGILGTTRMLPHLRAVLVGIGSLVISEQVTINRAASAFGEDGMPTDERQRAMLDSACRSLLAIAVPGRART